MQLSEDQIQRLADNLLSALLGSGSTVLKTERGRAIEAIVAIVRAELDRERDLEREALEVLETHLASAPEGIDRHRLLQMIKKRLAEERGIPL